MIKQLLNLHGINENHVHTISINPMLNKFSDIRSLMEKNECISNALKLNSIFLHDVVLGYVLNSDQLFEHGWNVDSKDNYYDITNEMFWDNKNEVIYYQVARLTADDIDHIIGTTNELSINALSQLKKYNKIFVFPR